MDKLLQLQRIRNLAESQSLERVQVRVARRSRWRRALRWPKTLLEYRRAGVSWRQAWTLTHWSIWWDLKDDSEIAK